MFYLRHLKYSEMSPLHNTGYINIFTILDIMLFDLSYSFILPVSLLFPVNLSCFALDSKSSVLHSKSFLCGCMLELQYSLESLCTVT